MMDGLQQRQQLVPRNAGSCHHTSPSLLIGGRPFIDDMHLDWNYFTLRTGIMSAFWSRVTNSMKLQLSGLHNVQRPYLPFENHLRRPRSKLRQKRQFLGEECLDSRESQGRYPGAGCPDQVFY